MNIFFVDRDPIQAARMLADAHIGKMMLESTQMLANAYYLPEALDVPPNKKNGQLYKQSHLNHPCSIWTLSSLNNWAWLIEHAEELSSIYINMKSKFHQCGFAISYMRKRYPMWLPDKSFSNPPLCMPDVYKQKDCVVAYRHYYTIEKFHLHKWTNRPIPQWIKSRRF